MGKITKRDKKRREQAQQVLKTLQLQKDDSVESEPGEDVVDCAPQSREESPIASPALDENNAQKLLGEILESTTQRYEDGSGDGRQRSLSPPFVSVTPPSYPPLQGREHAPRFTPTNRSFLQNNEKKFDPNLGNNIKIWALIGTLGCLLMACWIGIEWLDGNAVGYNGGDFQKELREIGTKYRIKGDTMLLIQSGIETTFKRQDTVSLVFLYNDENPENMSEKIVKQLVDEVAYASAKLLRNETSMATHKVVENSDLNIDTVGELINKYREDLKDQGVLLVQDLEDIPVNLAMAFHYYCDEFNPLEKKTAIFFTLNLAKCTKKDGRTEHEMVEGCLKEKWSRLEDTKLVPLLSRVVNVVVDLHSNRQ